LAISVLVASFAITVSGRYLIKYYLVNDFTYLLVFTLISNSAEDNWRWGLVCAWTINKRKLRA